MLDLNTGAVIAANENSGGSAVEKTTDGKSAVDDGDWFSNAAKKLYPAKSGTALHFLTGFDERICQRYAAGHVRPPAYLLRTILRSDHGWTWLCVIMHDSGAKWWRDTQFAVECASAFEAKRRELECPALNILPKA